MNTTWIVIANAARARVVERAADGSLAELADFVHPESRMPGRELAADRPGRGELDLGDQQRGRTAYEPPTDPRQKEHERFARELSAHLEREVGAGRCRALVVLASNPFLGELRAQLGAATNRALQASHASDLTALSLHELRPRIDELLRPGA